MDFVSGLAKKVQPKPSSDDQPSNPDHDKTSSNSDLFSNAKVVADAAQSQFRSEEYDKAKAAGAGADLLNAASDYGKLDDTQGIGKYVDQAEGYLRKYNTTDPATAVADEKTGAKVAESDDSAPAKTLGVDGGSDALKSAAGGGGDLSDLKSTATDAATATVGDSDDVKSTITDSASAAIDDSVSDIKTSIPTGDASTETDKASTGGVGDYITKAGGFLSKASGDGGEEKVGDEVKEEAEGGLKKPGEAAGDYAKEAEGILNKASGDDGEKTDAGSETQSGGIFGNVKKVAGGFLNK